MTTSIVFNKDLKIIGSSSFISASADNINDIVIPSNVRYIGGMAFAFGRSENFENKKIIINGKPYIGAMSINERFNIQYSGTCQELYNNSDYGGAINDKPTIVYGSGTYNVKTTDTDTCSVYGDYD